jgi:Fe-S cluster assembly protein SufD
MQLLDLPNRRVEAWKYSDLRAAMDECVQFVLRRDRAAPEVASALARGGVIGALAAQTGKVEEITVAAGAEIVRIDRPVFGNLEPRLLDATVESGARLTRIVVQAGVAGGVVLDAAHVRVAKEGVFRQVILAEGAKLARIETHVCIDGDAAEVELNGVYMCGEGRHADLTSVVEHKVGGGTTRQLIKGVARKGGRGVFQGKIVVARGAQKTDARQHHRGLLLEDGAEIFAKPELMIHADDVQCAHGNTAGGLDESALFYMRSRGVPEADARALLIEAFLTEAVPVWTPPEAHEEIVRRIRAWLAGGAL